jgi:hypothetical protein
MKSNPTSPVARVSVIVDSRIYGYLFAPIIRALIAKDVYVFVYSPQHVMNEIKCDIGVVSNIEYLNLDPIRKKNRWRWMLHRIGMDVLVRDDFSYQLFKRNQEITKALPLTRRLLVKLSRLLPKVPNKSINLFLERLAGFGLSNPFCTKTILAGSLNGSAELLSARDQVVVTVMESWDHAVKLPNGYTSELVFAWNEDLRKDWQRVHNDQNILCFYPLKLRYARSVVSAWDKPKNRDARPFFVYAVSSTRRFSIGVLTSLEQRLIRDLAKAADLAGWDLFIKPRPNGEQGEFSTILQEFSNVRVGSIVDEKVSYPADYFLSDDYNERRFSEIVGAEFIVNAFTTFGLDAAAAGIPVLQIDIRDADGYLESNLVYENYHIKNYLLPNDNVLKIGGDLVINFSKFLGAPDSSPQQYSSELAGWLFGGRTQARALDDLVDKTIHLALSGHHPNI